MIMPICVLTILNGYFRPKDLDVCLSKNLVYIRSKLWQEAQSVSCLNFIKAPEFRVFFWSQVFIIIFLQKIQNELNMIWKIVMVEIGMVSLIFKDKNGHSN